MRAGPTYQLDSFSAGYRGLQSSEHLLSVVGPGYLVMEVVDGVRSGPSSSKAPEIPGAHGLAGGVRSSQPICNLDGQFEPPARLPLKVLRSASWSPKNAPNCSQHRKPVPRQSL